MLEDARDKIEAGALDRLLDETGRATVISGVCSYQGQPRNMQVHFLAKIARVKCSGRASSVYVLGTDNVMLGSVLNVDRVAQIACEMCPRNPNRKNPSPTPGTPTPPDPYTKLKGFVREHREREKAKTPTPSPRDPSTPPPAGEMKGCAAASPCRGSVSEPVGACGSAERGGCVTLCASPGRVGCKWV